MQSLRALLSNNSTKVEKAGYCYLGEINEANYNQIITIANRNFTIKEIIRQLTLQHPKEIGFFKRQPYPITLDANDGSKPIECELVLENDIIFWQSFSSLDKIPTFVFRPVIEKGKRTIKPHLKYLPDPAHLHAPRMNNPDVERFGLFNAKVDILLKKGHIGKGGFGAVFRIDGTLTEANDFNIKKNKDRIVKVIHLEDKGKHKTTEQNIAKATQEINYLLETGHMKAKTLVIDKARKIAFIIQKRGEMNLTEFLDSRVAMQKQLTADEVYKISINILRALKEQCYDNGIISLDVKPGNILIDPQTLEILHIDFGIARKVIDDTLEEKGRGTILYMPPELKHADKEPFVPDERTASYALGKILPYICDSSSELIFSQTALKYISEDLTWRNPNDRIYLQKAIADLAYARIAHCYKQQMNRELDESAELKVNQAIKNGEELREKLKIVANAKEYLIENLEALLIEAEKAADPKLYANAKDIQEALLEIARQYQDRIAASQFVDRIAQKNPIEATLTAALENTIAKATKIIQELETALDKKSDLERLQAEIEAKLKEIDDEPIVIQAFIQTLDIQCLYGLTSKKAITEKVGEIIASSKMIKESLLNLEISLSDGLDTTQKTFLEEYKNLLKEVYRLQYKFAKKECKLDVLDNLQKTVPMQIADLEKRIDAFKSRKNNSSIQQRTI